MSTRVMSRISRDSVVSIRDSTGCRQELFCTTREKISDGLYDNPHRVRRFVFSLRYEIMDYKPTQDTTPSRSL